MDERRGDDSARWLQVFVCEMTFNCEDCMSSVSFVCSEIVAGNTGGVSEVEAVIESNNA